MTDHPRQQLQHIILHYGRSICDEPKRCEALLRDLCPDNRREINLLMGALREGVAKDLLSVGQGVLPIETVMTRLSQGLHADLGFAEPLALWAVESWALALGISLAAVATPLVEPLPKASPPATAKPAALTATDKQFAGWQKIGGKGESLTADATQWAAAKHEKSGLMWAVNAPSLAKEITWYEAQEWVKRVNSTGWCGYNDWRLPTIDELKTLLVAENKQGLHIRTDIFTDISSSNYWVWSSSQYDGDANSVWLLYLYYGYAYYYSKYKYGSVRVVRSGQGSAVAAEEPPFFQPPPKISPPASAKSVVLAVAEKQFADWEKIGAQGEPLASDASSWAAARHLKSGLMWAVSPDNVANFPNPAKPITWHEAQEWVKRVNCTGWCGYNDWCLPTIDELKTLLTAEKQQWLHIRRDCFPDVPSDGYYRVWSSSPDTYDGYSGWIVNFSFGNTYRCGNKGNIYYVRVVRSDQGVPTSVEVVISSQPPPKDLLPATGKLAARNTSEKQHAYYQKKKPGLKGEPLAEDASLSPAAKNEKTTRNDSVLIRVWRTIKVLLQAIYRLVNG